MRDVGDGLDDAGQGLPELQDKGVPLLLGLVVGAVQ